MANVVVRGKDATSGQVRELRSTDTATDDAGTPIGGGGSEVQGYHLFRFTGSASTGSGSLRSDGVYNTVTSIGSETSFANGYVAAFNGRITKVIYATGTNPGAYLVIRVVTNPLDGIANWQAHESITTDLDSAGVRTLAQPLYFRPGDVILASIEVVGTNPGVISAGCLAENLDFGGAFSIPHGGNSSFGVMNDTTSTSYDDYVLPMVSRVCGVSSICGTTTTSPFSYSVNGSLIGQVSRIGSHESLTQWLARTDLTFTLGQYVALGGPGTAMKADLWYTLDDAKNYIPIIFGAVAYSTGVWFYPFGSRATGTAGAGISCRHYLPIGGTIKGAMGYYTVAGSSSNSVQLLVNGSVARTIPLAGTYGYATFTDLSVSALDYVEFYLQAVGGGTQQSMFIFLMEV